MTQRIVLPLLASALLILPWAGDAGAKKHNPRAVKVECSSLGERYTLCRTFAIGAVRLERQLSKTSCRQYKTWGASGDGSSVWVSSGCRGVFVVSRGGRPGPGPARTITCTSKSYDYNHCDVATWGRDVYVKRQISDSRCIQGNNWGADWTGIWVDRGCNAEFAIQ